QRAFVLLDVDEGEAGRLATLPAGAESILRKLPRAFALDARRPAHRFARHLAVRGEHHLELDVGWRRGRERLPGEEGILNLFRRQLGQCECAVAEAEQSGRCDGRSPCTHVGPPWWTTDDRRRTTDRAV